MEDFLQVGVIASTHGLRGEVKVFPTTDDARRFDDLKQVFLDTGREKLALDISGVKYFKKFVIVKFKGIDHINDIEKYKGKALLVERSQAVPLGENEYFIADLIGMKVMSDTGENGVLVDVIETGANDVYMVDFADLGKVMIPAIKDCILAVDMDEGFIKVHLLDGLADSTR